MHLSTHLGLALSGLGHVLLFGVALLLLAHPRVWDATSLPVAVDIVPEREVLKVKPEPSQGLPAERQQEAGAAAAKPAPSPPAAPEPAAQQSAEQQSGQQQSAQQPSSPQREPWAAPTPAAAGAGLAPWPTAQAGQPAAPTPNPLFYSLNIPGITELEFDAPADASARLTPEEMGAFHAQLRKCWHPPASVAGAPKLRAMVRIALTPTGTLARDPLLVRASASAEWPRLVEAARRALQECQPFSFLPAERYQDWKLLDLTFGPQGLSGG